MRIEIFEWERKKNWKKNVRSQKFLEKKKKKISNDFFDDLIINFTKLNKNYWNLKNELIEC